MRYTSFYTIKELDYKAIEASLSKENIPIELRNTLQTLIDDHKAIIECRKKIVEQQNVHANALFQLFDESSEENNENINNTPLNNEENNNSQNSNNVEVENNSQNSPENEEEESKNSSEPKSKNRKNGGKKKLPTGKIINHSLTKEEKKCSGCGSKMHKQRSKTKTYVLALPFLSTETHTLESCRCLSCDTQATAVNHNPLNTQCIGRYHFSAVSSLAALRYQYGMASYRMESMSDAIGLKVADSTQWTLFEKAASLVKPFVCFLENQVANAPKQHTDDTHNIVLSLTKDIEAEQEQALLQGKNPDNVRSGIHTTNLTGVFEQGQIILYKTGLHHAGEILAQILSKRTLDEQVIIMSDASSAITSKINLEENKNIKIANCNSHNVRNFQEIADAEEKTAKDNRIKDHKTSEYLDYFLSRYKIIFENDKKTKNMSLQDRLLFHKENSLPLMLQMKNRVDESILKKEFEPNSQIGKSYKYFKNHFEKLCAFCKFEGAPVCNNLSERMLKSIIRHRKNSLFFKTQLGATVADTLTSILFTAKANNLNSIDYFKDLLLHQALWKEKPEEWLPWNYLNTINKLKNNPE